MNGLAAHAAADAVTSDCPCIGAQRARKEKFLVFHSITQRAARQVHLARSALWRWGRADFRSFGEGSVKRASNWRNEPIRESGPTRAGISGSGGIVRKMERETKPFCARFNTDPRSSTSDFSSVDRIIPCNLGRVLRMLVLVAGYNRAA